MIIKTGGFPMRAFPVVLAVLLGLTAAVHADSFTDLTNEISETVFGPLSKAVSRQLADHMGFYAGSGNMTAVNASPFVGLKFGAGIGLALSYISRKGIFEKDFGDLTNGVSGSNINSVTNLAKALSLIPLPYDVFYLKMGLPGIPLDLGLRFGYYPQVSRDATNGTSLDFKAGYVGLEARYLAKEFFGGLIKIDTRLSADYNSGLLGMAYRYRDSAYVTNMIVGTNDAETGFTIDWAGLTLGGKVMAGINFSWIGGVFAGLGVDLNLGRVSTDTYIKGTFTDLTGTDYALVLGRKVDEFYRPLEVRILFGIQLLFASASFEYGIVSRDLAFNVFPIALAF